MSELFNRKGVINALLAFVAALCICAVPAVYAQTSATGALTGTVTDPSGAVIAGATVTATNAGTGQTRTVTTDANGAYKFSLLPPGNYDVKFSAQGFKTAEVPSITVNVTETPVLNHALEIGSEAQQVTVQSNAPRIQTQNATVGQLIGSREMTSLPLSSRNYTQILDLSPGVVTNVASGALLGTGTQDINVNGSNSSQNNYQMDGAVITNYASGEAAQQNTYGSIAVPNPDSLQEFQVQTAQYDASYGRNPGANVNVVTKGGTNNFHGDAWEFFRNNFLNANEYFLKQTQLSPGGSGVNTPQILKQNQFGFTFGGPIKKDKIFFFTSYQGTRQINGVVSQGYSPGVNLPAINDYADAASGVCANIRCTNNLPAYQAFLGSQFGASGSEPQAAISGTVPIAADGSNINPVAIALLQAPGLKGGVNQGFFVPGAPASCAAPCRTSLEDPARANEDQFMINTDYVLSSRNTFSERFFYSYAPTVSNIIASMPGAPADSNYSNDVGTLRLTSVLTSNLVNEARFSLDRKVTVATDAWDLSACDVGMIPSINNGAPCPAVSGANADMYKVPAVSVAGVPVSGFPNVGTFSFGGNTSSDAYMVINSFQGADQVSWNHGRQSIRAGFEADRTQWFYNSPGLNRGALSFNTFGDFLYGQAGTLAGSGSGENRGPLQGQSNDTRGTNLSAYIQDDIKATKHLTVNLGLRWEYDGLPNGADGQLTGVWSSLLDTVNAGSFFLNNPQGTLAGFAVQSNYPVQSYGLTAPSGATGVYVNTNKSVVPDGSPLDVFSPRLGFAWQPVGNRLVIRGGYGWFHDSVFGADFVKSLQGNPPQGATYSPAQIPLQTLANPFPASYQGLSCPATGGVCPALGWVPRSIIAPPRLVGVSQAYQIPLVQEYNLDVQYQLPSNWIVSVGYVGSHGIHLVNFDRQSNPDYIISGAPNTPSGLLGEAPVSALPYNDALNPVGQWMTTNDGPTRSSITQNQIDRVPYLGLTPGGGFSVVGTDGDSLYDSLQVVARHQFSHGLAFQAAYTWSKLLSDLSGGVSGGGPQNGNIIYGTSNSGYPLNNAQQYGLAAFNRGQRLVLSYNYDIPFKGEGWTKKALGGWSISGVTTLQSGEPFSITDPAGGSIYGYTSSTGTSRAELAHPVDCNAATANCKSAVPFGTPGGVEARLNCYIAFVTSRCSGITAATAAVAVSGSEPMIGGDPNSSPGPYTGNCTTSATGTTEFVNCGTIYGNSGVGVITGPGQWNWDMALAKTLPVTEGTHLEFRAEAFNIWNHTQFNNPSGSVNSSLFGVITSTSVPPRIIQFGLKFYF
ncbi:MAG: TonB-dependent receptor [Candidatus Acidiferrales bacterium]